MRNISIILGYGVLIKPNPDYQKYLDLALKLCLQNKPDRLIICGGHTSSKYPHLSEAESISQYLFSQPGKINVVLEDQSLTTYQNLLFSKNIIGTDIKTLDSLFVVGDSIRVPKIYFHSLEIFSPLFSKTLTTEDRLRLLATESQLHNQDTLPDPITFSFEKLKVQGVSLSQSPKIIAQQITTSMIESHYSTYPGLHEDFIKWRKKEWGFK